MPFKPPSYVPKLPFEIPDSVSIEQFLLTDRPGQAPLSKSKDPFTCGLTGKTYSALDVKARVDALARGLGKELGFKVNEGSEYDKVVGVYTLNSIDFCTLAWATHRLGGILSPANAQYSQSELEYQLKDAGAKCLFTCHPLLDIARGACKKVGIPENRIYLFDLSEVLGSGSPPSGIKLLDDLIREGSKLGQLEKLKWRKGEGAKRTAFLCYSSGTSGLPKGVMISHRNVIANCIQMALFEKRWRGTLAPKGSHYTAVAMGLLPMSHIYALVVICHEAMYRGDCVIVLPKFDMKSYLQSIATYRIEILYLVPPIVIMMAKSAKALQQYDLSSIKCVFCGAAPLGEETAAELQRLYPSWLMRQAYGMTETSTVVTWQEAGEILPGSIGVPLPDVEARVVTSEGKEITGYDEPGELWIKSPSVTLGYLNNEKATREAYEDGWLKTGDEVVVRKHPKTGSEHFFITDRIKELIKVKGLQVAPAELEAHLLAHPAVHDCVVIGVPSEKEGEVPKAFIVKSPSVGLEESAAGLKRDIAKHVEKHKAKHKWLKGGIEFIDEVPKSPSGKILRRMIRDKDKENRRAKGAKL